MDKANHVAIIFSKNLKLDDFHQRHKCGVNLLTEMKLENASVLRNRASSAKQTPVNQHRVLLPKKNSKVLLILTYQALSRPNE